MDGSSHSEADPQLMVMVLKVDGIYVGKSGSLPALCNIITLRAQAEFQRSY